MENNMYKLLCLSKKPLKRYPLIHVVNTKELINKMKIIIDFGKT